MVHGEEPRFFALNNLLKGLTPQWSNINRITELRDDFFELGGTKARQKRREYASMSRCQVTVI